MGAKKTVLVIDDDIDILESLSLVLTAEGFEVLTVSSGREGLALLDQRTPDIILCDMMMESIDAGMQTAQQIKQRLPHVPIFLLSSIAAATAATTEISELGFSGVLQKPVDPQHVVTVVKHTLRC
ncbi:MAG: response regulator [Desulfobacterota bacterium]|nr:response regulator [Thermodesulfobacteriota bacterium]